jgi:hypothetical protein
MFALVPAAMLCALPGCGGSGAEEGKVHTEQPEEIEEANNQMEEFMKSQGQK